jgi:hypothetical protein
MGDSLALRLAFVTRIGARCHFVKYAVVDRIFLQTLRVIARLVLRDVCDRAKWQMRRVQRFVTTALEYWIARLNRATTVIADDSDC